MESTPSAHEAPPIKPKFVTEFVDVLRYVRTYKAVWRGIPLHEFTRADLDRDGFSGPWTFNLQQAALSALPAILVFTIYDFVFPLKSSPVALRDPFWQAVRQLFPVVHGKISPIFPPLALTITAFAAAFGSLRWRDVSRPALERNSRAFLYYDGAYGFVPQMLLAFFVGLLTPHAVPDGPLQPYVVGSTLVIGVVGIGAALYQLYLHSRYIPRKLFALQGYDLAIRSFWQRATPGGAPWSYFMVCFVIVAGTASFLVFSALELVAYGIAFFAVWLKLKTLGHV